MSNSSLWRPLGSARPCGAISYLMLAVLALLSGCESAPAVKPLKQAAAARMTLSFALAPAPASFCVWDLSVTLGIGDPLAVAPTQTVPGKSCAPLAMSSMHWQELPSYDVPYRHYRTAIVQFRRQAGGPVYRHDFSIPGGAPRAERQDMGLQVSVLPAGVRLTRWDAKPSTAGLSANARTFEYTLLAELRDSQISSKPDVQAPGVANAKRAAQKSKRVAGK